MNGKYSREYNNDLLLSKKSLNEVIELEKDDEVGVRDSHEIKVNRSGSIDEKKLQESPRRKLLEKKRKVGKDDIEGFDKIHPYELNPFEIGLKNSYCFRVHIAGSIEIGTVIIYIL